MITLAPLEDGEIEDIARLFHRLWHHTQARLQDPRIARHRDLDFFRQRVTERAGRTITARVDGRLAGFTTWTGSMLNSLFVETALHGRGVGTELCAEAERHMAETGATTFELHCIEGNHRAKAFYEARGWGVARLEELENQTPEGLCRVSTWVMVKALQSSGPG